MPGEAGRIEFSEWLPDIPYILNKGLAEARNVIPSDRAYRDYLALSTSGDALDSTPLGGFAALDTAGDTFIYSATAEQLLVKNGTSWDDLSASTYNTAASGYWRFTQFDDLVIATNYADTMQAATIGASTFGALGTTGTAPRARQIAVVNRFVMAADTDGVGGTNPTRVQWCAINNPRDWPTPATSDARAKQAGAEILPVAYGAATAISGGQFYGLVFQQRAINRFTYVGGDVVFQIQDYEKSRGCWFPQSLAEYGQLRFFISATGFHMTDGQQVVDIGKERVDKFFLQDCDQAYKERVRSAIDYANKCVLWCYPNFSAVDGMPNQVMIYQLPSQSFPQGRWAHAEDEMQILFSSISDGYTLDQLDDLYASIDSIPLSLDSPVWQGGQNTMMAFGSDNKLGTFSGAALPARIETGEFELNPIGYYFVRGIRPMITGNPTTIRVSIGSRTSQNDQTRTFSTPVGMSGRTGQCDFRQKVRFGTVRVEMTGNFDAAIGFSVNGSPSDGV